ncbi:MAG: uracil-xanthine permease [Clostridia bacterium]|nr:uracil-xanthine permease [Clostridia bacterium]
MKLIYDINDRPALKKTIVFAFQQMIAIMAATLLVPILMSGFDQSGTLNFDPAAALCGAGVGTLVYLFFTKRRSPVFLGSSFTFLGAYAAVIGMNYGYLGVMIGIAFAGLVYVVIALIVKATGSGWVNKLMPAVIIGPIVALIGLSLSGTATGWMQTNGNNPVTTNTLYISEKAYVNDENGLALKVSEGEGEEAVAVTSFDEEGNLVLSNDYYTVKSESTNPYSLITIVVGVFTFLAIVFVSIKGTKGMKLIPFIIGIAAGYILALILTLIGKATDTASLQILSFEAFEKAFTPFKFTSILDYPKFTFIKVIQEYGKNAANVKLDGSAIANIAITFVPIGIVELAQHIADHKNLSNIVNRDLITDPGLDKTLLGDGVGSIVGGIFGGAANTTYGESIGCVAITGNASIVSILGAAIGCIVLSFFTPFVAFINSIPKCVMGGACIAMYGFIAVSGLQMLKNVDLGNSKNLFVVAAILVCGIGGLTLEFGSNSITGGSLLSITALATAFIVGVITNLIVNNGKMSSGEDNMVSGHAENMGMVKDPEKK